MIKILIVFSVFLTSEIHAQQNYNKLNVKELDVTSRVNVTSTTKSSKPCPAMTETQRNAIATPLNGSCIYNTTTSKLNVYNGTVWKAAGGGVDNWLTVTAYSVDDIVIESSKIYQCLTAHTSGTFATDLAALKWAEISSTIPVNLTGPITSVGNATSIASQTGTGSTFVVQNTPTLTTPNIGAATGTSLTLAGNISAYNYDKDDLLTNGNVENPLGAEWVCTTGTVAATSTSGEVGKGTYALKMTSGSGTTIRCYQTMTTLAGAPVQHHVKGFYKFLLVDLPDFQICSLINGNLLANEQTCIPTASLIGDNTYRPFEIPITVTPGQSVGVVFKTTATSTAKSAFVDTMALKQGLGLQNLQGNAEYSASIGITALGTACTTGTCTTFNPNKTGWISCNWTATGQYTCALTGFTVAPTCNITAVQNPFSTNHIVGLVNTISASSISLTMAQPGVGNGNMAFNISCQKSGNDYLASSSNVYSQASANYDWTNTTVNVLTNLGTSPSPATVGQCKHSRVGGDLLMDCSFTAGTSVPAALGSIDLPNSLTIDTTKIIAQNTTAAAGQKVGTIVQSAAGNIGHVVTALGTSTSKVYLSTAVTASNTLVPTNSNGFISASTLVSVSFRVPISGWSNSNVIVGSFENVPIVPGAGARIDIFSVAFGDALNTACTSANGVVCPYIKTIGAGASITHGATAGAYNLIAPRTYIELQCLSGTEINNHVSTSMSCSNCNGHAFAVTNALTANGTNAYGNVSCIGTY